MEKVTLNHINRNLSSIESTTTSCTCPYCGFCLLCVAFAPLVGVALGFSVGLDLNANRSFNS